MKPIETFLKEYKKELDFLEAVRQVVNYMSDEEKNYQECEPKEKRNHIFKSVKVLDEFVKEQTPILLGKFLSEAKKEWK